MNSSAKRFRLLAVDDESDILSLYQATLAPEELNIRAQILGDPEARALRERWQINLKSYFGDGVETACDCVSQGHNAISLVEQSLAQQQPYAVAFIDIRMPPGIDGLETATRIRALDPNIQIFIITAFSDYSVDQIQEQLGYNVVVLTKPFYPSDLLQFTAHAIRSWERNQEVDRLKQRLSSSLPVATPLSWSADIVEDRFFPSEALLQLLLKGQSGTITTLSGFVQRFHPDERDSILGLLQDYHEFFTLLHRIEDVSGHYHWMLSQGRIQHNDQGVATEITSQSSLINAPTALMGSTAESNIELLSLRRLSTIDLNIGIPGRNEMVKLCSRLLDRGHHFSLFRITIHGITEASERSGESAGEQLITQCLNHIRPLLPADHQEYRYDESTLTILLQGNASSERLTALQQQLEDSLDFIFSPLMLKIPVTTEIAFFQSQRDREEIEQLLGRKDTG